MNTGKTLFAQLMDFLPWTTFARYVHRYGGDRGVRTMYCARPSEEAHLLGVDPIGRDHAREAIQVADGFRRGVGAIGTRSKAATPKTKPESAKRLTRNARIGKPSD